MMDEKRVYSGRMIIPESLYGKSAREIPRGHGVQHGTALTDWAAKHAREARFLHHGCEMPIGWRKLMAGPSTAHLDAGLDPVCVHCGSSAAPIPIAYAVDTQNMQSGGRGELW